MLCKVAMSLDHHSGDLALRSPKIIVNLISEQSLLLSKSSKPGKNCPSQIACMVMTVCNRYANGVMYTQKFVHGINPSG